MSTYLRTATLRLTADREAPRRVRAALRDTCPDLPGDLLGDAELLATEVVTNCVLHSGCPLVTVAIQCDPSSVRVAVADGSDLQPVQRHAAHGAENGRGVQLLDAMATAWGVRPASTPPGKTVWFLLGTV